MGVIRTNAAAAMLGVSPNTLRSWERRFGFPSPRRTQGGHRQFDLAEIEALRTAFEETHNVSSAISIARERGSGPATPQRMKSAFGRFDHEEADRVLEESLSVIRQEVLPAFRQRPGFNGILSLMNPERGTSITISLCQTETDMQASDRQAQGLRAGAAEAGDDQILSVERFEVGLYELSR